MHVVETTIVNTGLGVEWWTNFRDAYRAAGRLTGPEVTAKGLRYFVEADDGYHAYDLRDLMYREGLPFGAVQVVIPDV